MLFLKGINMKKKCSRKIPFITRFLFFPISRILGRKFPKYFKDLQKSQFYSIEKLREIQLRKLKNVFEIAYKNVDFYNELYKTQGLKLSEINSLEDITKLPIINKKIYKIAYPKKSINREINTKKIIENSTSGSTGKPFVFVLNIDKKDRNEAIHIRNFELTGYAFGRKYYSLWSFTPQESKISKIYKKIIQRKKWLSCVNLSDEILENYSQLLMKNPNIYLDGYSSALVILAKYMIKRGYKTNLCGVTSSAESLVPKHRELLEQAFGSRVYNRYGTREFGGIAINCTEKKGLHINMESVIVEIVDSNGNPCKPGEKGRIIITDLENIVMPFIRYDTEDSAALMKETCTCGRESIMLQPPSGRIVDTIRTPDGRHLSFGYFVLIFEDFPIVDQFQILQKSKDTIDLLIIKNKSFNEETFLPLLNKVVEYCKPMKVILKYVDKIPLEKSGKMRIVKGMDFSNV